jgi:hypothetical protein
MSKAENATVTLKNCWFPVFVHTDALAKLLIEKGIITQQEFSQKISQERATYQAMFQADTTLTQMNVNGCN